jgi:hypothetical protein
VAGRFGYCGLDRTRAALQGDEVRDCWQAPSRTESYEGLFRELTVLAGPAPAEPTVVPREAGQVSDDTRTWVIPVIAGMPRPALPAPDSPAPGLVEARYVPARRIVSVTPRTLVDEAELPDLELRGPRSGPTAGDDDPGRDNDRSAGGALTQQPEA